ncbi:unnamed protein product [Strongylus vulgaris]|uniref:PDZ domain-containing protein n=1 Tax=Strongylus vulgaris TaxID=40348 RepID=A0A3P7ITK6_STRVU|nr:unnamed protein product [Strongylus vulgaris]
MVSFHIGCAFFEFTIPTCPLTFPGSQLGSPDRQGSPPYTVLRKESQSSRSSRSAGNRKGELSPSSSRPHSAISDKPNSVAEEQQVASKDSEGVGPLEATNLSQTVTAAGEADDERPSTQKGLMDTTLTGRTPSLGSDNFGQQTKQVARSKFWGEARTVILQREPNKSFGISIVGGRVEVSQKGGLPGTGNTVSGIFIKSVLPNSPAGKSGMMNMGDRVISVS